MRVHVLRTGSDLCILHPVWPHRSYHAPGPILTATAFAWGIYVTSAIPIDAAKRMEFEDFAFLADFRVDAAGPDEAYICLGSDKE